MPRTLLLNSLLLLSLLLAACASTSSKDAGFLADYAQLEVHPDDPDTRRWLSPAAGYHGEVLVVPHVAYFHKNVHGHAVNADELALTR